MVNSSRVLDNFLQSLGLDEDERALYSTLALKGPLTILDASRKTGINRTSLYRLAENMVKEGLLEEIVDENHKLLKAIEPHKLEFLIEEQEIKAKQLRQLLPEVSDLLSASSQLSQPGTEVKFYRGLKGIKQMVWNTLRAEKEILGFTFRSSDEYGDSEFMRKWKDEVITRNLKFRELYSDVYVESLSKPLEEVQTGIKKSFDKKHFDSRYVPSSVLDITYQMDIYDIVVSSYNWRGGEIFGVEIYNQEIADMQKQFFEIVWGMPVRLTDTKE